MRELSLFSGGGGGLLASRLLGWRTIGAVEINEYCCRVLEQRQRDGKLERFPIFQTDIRDFIRNGYAALYEGKCDVISAGFPCVSFSLAGKRKGGEDERNMGPPPLSAFARYDHDSASWRTFQVSLLTHTSMLFSGTWLRAGIIVDGVAYRQPRWERRIREIGSGLWPTPTSRDWKDGTAESCKNVPENSLLGRAVHHWPTPRSCSAMVAVITKEAQEKARRRFPNLETVMAIDNPDAVGGRLNPEFVEWLQGFPRGWTSLESTVSHVMMGYQLGFQKRLNNGEIKRRPGEVLFLLQGEATAQAHQQSHGGHDNLQKTEVLQSSMYGKGTNEGGCAKVGPIETHSSPTGEKVRNVRDDRKSSKSPQGWELAERKPLQPNDIVRLLSYEMALEEWEEVTETAIGLQILWGACQEAGYVSKALPALQEVWKFLSDEEKDWVAIRLSSGNSWCREWYAVPRVVNNIRKLANRIRSLGNAQVPLCAATAWRLLTEDWRLIDVMGKTAEAKRMVAVESETSRERFVPVY